MCFMEGIGLDCSCFLSTLMECDSSMCKVVFFCIDRHFLVGLGQTLGKRKKLDLPVLVYTAREIHVSVLSTIPLEA